MRSPVRPAKAAEYISFAYLRLSLVFYHVFGRMHNAKWVFDEFYFKMVMLLTLWVSLVYYSRIFFVFHEIRDRSMTNYPKESGFFERKRTAIKASCDLEKEKIKKQNEEVWYRKISVSDPYNLFDATHLAYSTLKLTDIAQKDFSDHLFKTPGGLASLALFSVLLGAFASLSSIDLKKRSAREVRWLTFMNTVYKDFREGAQAVKYVNKSVNNIWKLLQHSGLDVKNLLLPTIALVSILSVASRIYLRHSREDRKKLLDRHKKILAFFEEAEKKHKDDGDAYKKLQQTRDREALEALLDEIQRESDYNRIFCLLLVTFNGTVDATYSYFGLLGFLTLSALGSTELILLVSLCAIYLMVLVATRIAEESQQQKELEIAAIDSELKIYIALREILREKQLLDAQEILVLQGYEETICRLSNRKEEITPSELFNVLLQGLKKGTSLNAIIGVCTAMISTFCGFFGVSLVMAVPVTAIALGLVCILGAVAYQVSRHYAEKPAPLLNEGLRTVHLPLTQQFTYLDSLRSTISGFIKSFKVACLLFSRCKTLNEQGKEMDALWVLAVVIPYALCSGYVHWATGEQKNKARAVAKIEEKEQEIIEAVLEKDEENGIKEEADKDQEYEEQASDDYSCSV